MTRSSIRNPIALTGAGIAAVLAMQLWLAFNLAINWDEFFYFSEVARFVGGEDPRPLQTLHVRLFAWLTQLPGTAIDQIVAGRLVMLACQVVTMAAIASTGAHFSNWRTGLLCALAYVAGGSVLRHGFSFRTDPLAAALLMTSLWLFVTERLNAIRLVATGLLAAIAAMVTIKVVLYAPAFAAVAWMRWEQAGRDRGALVRLAALTTITAVCFAILYLLHSGYFQAEVAQEVVTDQADAIVRSAGQDMISLGTGYPSYVMQYALWAIPVVPAIILTPLCLRNAALDRPAKVALAGMWGCLLVLFFYKNTLPYFFAFLTPPILVACCVAFPAIVRRYSVTALVAALVINAAIVTFQHRDSRIERQQQIVLAADMIFPEPVAYFDFPGMLPTFQKANGFMTNWGIMGYLRAGRPVYTDTLTQRPVPLLLANDPVFNPTFNAVLADKPDSRPFLAEDAATLRDTYVPFWGPFWLAGEDLAAGETRKATIRVPGPYTVRGNSISINGKAIQVGDVVEMERGEYTLAATIDGPARLIWGDRLRKPRNAPPPRPIWTDF